MERPPLTTVLTSVLSAAVENTNRPALLATLSPQLRDHQQAGAGDVIPMQRRSPESVEQPDPAPAA